jgi:hypothetical protein
MNDEENLVFAKTLLDVDDMLRLLGTPDNVDKAWLSSTDTTPMTDNEALNGTFGKAFQAGYVRALVDVNNMLAIYVKIKTSKE